MEKLREFLKKNNACEDGYIFAKDMTLKEFLEKCDRGDWILWLFQRMNPEKIRELTLAKAHCANTVRHLMSDERSVKAVDVAIAFGEGRATREELDDVAYAADAAYEDASDAYDASDASDAAYAASATAVAGAVADGVAVAVADAYASARKTNQRKTADICRKYLPFEIWNKY